MENKKVGRPYVGGKPKPIKMTVMLDKEEHERLKLKAKAHNMSMSEYLRYLIKKF